MNPQAIPRYSTSVAAQAVGLPRKELDRWLSRGAFTLEPNDTNAQGHGRPRRWSARTIHKLGVMSALSALGITPARSRVAADQIIRRTEYFDPDYRTFAVCEAAGTVRVVTLTKTQAFQDEFDDQVCAGDSLIIIDLTKLFARLDERLRATPFTSEDSK